MRKNDTIQLTVEELEERIAPGCPMAPFMPENANPGMGSGNAHGAGAGFPGGADGHAVAADNWFGKAAGNGENCGGAR